jgi:hypothetical protein
MSAYNIPNPIKFPPIKISTNYRVKKNEIPKINAPNKQNPFDNKEEQIIGEIYSAINKEDYNLLYQILNRLPNFKEITDLNLQGCKYNFFWIW